MEQYLKEDLCQEEYHAGTEAVGVGELTEVVVDVARQEAEVVEETEDGEDR